MKRIIAAALSVLVGAFGYTIVDQAMEDRVATLESEVVELREEVSRYHPKYETSFDDITTTTEEDIITTETTEGFTGINVGDYLYESQNSIRKFLIYVYNSGKYEYIPSNNPPKTTTTRSLSGAETTTQPYVINEHFLYLTDVTAQWTKTEEETSYSYGYDKDYSQVSRKYITEKNYITVKYRGYTDPQLAGAKINFVINGYRGDYGWQPMDNINITSNLIDENGRFEFEATYCREFYTDSFYIGSIVIK